MNEKIMKVYKKALSKKNRKYVIIAFVVLLLIVIISTATLPKDERITLKNAETMQECLLDKSSVVIYDAYINYNYGDEVATLIYFGAGNSLGGITDDWAFVSKDKIQFYSDYKRAERLNDNDNILLNGDVAFAYSDLKMSQYFDDAKSRWKQVNIEKINKKL